MAVLILAALALALGALALIIALFRSRKQGNLTEEVRSMAGLLAVLGSDGAISAAAVWGIGSVSKDSNQVVALLTSAFTAMTAITTAYFGIKAVSNTAQRAFENGHGRGKESQDSTQGNQPPGQAGQGQE